LCKYFTVSKEDIEWQIYCTCFGSSVYTPGTTEYPLRPKEHPDSYVSNWQEPGKGRVLEEFQLLYITRGRGAFFSGGELFRITEGTAFFLLPGVPHWYCPDIDSGWNEYWVGFSGAYPEHLVKRGFITKNQPVYKTGVRNELVEGFHEIRDLADNQPPAFQHRCGSVVINLIAKILSFSTAQEQGSETDKLISSARILFEENLYTSLGMDEIVKSLKVDYGWFRGIFKSYTGLSPYQYFLQMKINKAKQILQTGELTVKETAYKLGFENQYYFSRIFKNKTGISPKGWQERNRLS
jgi:AraC-like DNA-binding protein